MESDTNKINLMLSMMRHREYLKEGVQNLCHELNSRATVHDLSKLTEDEVEGFAKINGIARNFKYGSQEYIDSMKDSKDVIHLHFSRNSHHPEFHTQCKTVFQDEANYGYEMGWLDIIEMVLDWRAAWKGYDTGNTWKDTIEIQRKRFKSKFSEHRWWLVEEIAKWVAQNE